jgi:hypothetical protein
MVRLDVPVPVRLIAVLLSATVVGCGPTDAKVQLFDTPPDADADADADADSDTDADADADADTDADVDADTDADADSDTDADVDLRAVPIVQVEDDTPVYESHTTAQRIDAVAYDEGEQTVGRITYEHTYDDETLCDLEVAVKGSKYTGDCDDCLFAFHIDHAEAVRDDSAPDCTYAAWATLLPESAPSEELVLAFRSEVGSYYGYDYDYYGAHDADEPYYYYGYRYYDVLQIGYDYGSHVSWRTLLHSTSGTGSASLADGELQWELDTVSTGVDWEPTLWDYCGGDYWDTYASSSYIGSAPRSGTLPCDPYTGEAFADSWSFEAEAGAEYGATVDVLDGSDYFAPYMFVTDHESCITAYSYGAFRCSSGGGWCPSVRFRADTDGPHEVVVVAAECGSTEGSYVVDVGAFD